MPAQSIVLKRFGENVRRRRKALTLTQEKLAEKASLHPTYVSGIERGIRNPTILSTANIASALKCSISDLCCEIESGGQGTGARTKKRPVSLTLRSTMRILKAG